MFHSQGLPPSPDTYFVWTEPHPSHRLHTAGPGPHLIFPPFVNIFIWSIEVELAHRESDNVKNNEAESKISRVPIFIIDIDSCCFLPASLSLLSTYIFNDSYAVCAVSSHSSPYIASLSVFLSHTFKFVHSEVCPGHLLCVRHCIRHLRYMQFLLSWCLWSVGESER